MRRIGLAARHLDDLADCPAPPEKLPIPIEIDGAVSVSAFQIGLYASCQRRFFYTHVLNVGGRRTPTPFLQLHDAVRAVFKERRPQSARQGARPRPRDDDDPRCAIPGSQNQGQVPDPDGGQASCGKLVWSDGEPIDPSLTIDQAINGGYPWLEIECSRCRTKRDVDLAALPHPSTTFVHDLASRLRCGKCAKANRRPAATLLQLAQRPRQAAPET
ncbi:hypothetical protein ACVWZV_001049 [Bradyrhizobium sp. GM5.1]